MLEVGLLDRDDIDVLIVWLALPVPVVEDAVVFLNYRLPIVVQVGT